MTGRDSRTRFTRRQWRRRLRALVPYLVGALVAAALGFVGWIVFFSSWLAVDRVAVEGERLLTDGQVLQAANIETGTPLARVDVGAVTDRLEEIPEVAEVSVQRSWPHTITITVTERTPVAVTRHGGDWWLMDGGGVLFRRIDDQDQGLPVVRTPEGLGEEALREVAEVVTVLPEDLLADTRRVQAKTMDSITLQLSGGRSVVWGSAAESARKVEVLRVLLERPARVYDVSVPEQPTVVR